MHLSTPHISRQDFQNDTGCQFFPSYLTFPFVSIFSLFNSLLTHIIIINNFFPHHRIWGWTKEVGSSAEQRGTLVRAKAIGLASTARTPSSYDRPRRICGIV